MLIAIWPRLFLNKTAVSVIGTLSRKQNMSSSPFLQVLAVSMTATNKAGTLIRDIMSGGKLDIVEKTGADDLQVLESIHCNFVRKIR